MFNLEGTSVAIENIIFEQPLNEQMRVCLRLEFLFQQIEHHLAFETSWDARAIINTLFEILCVIDRPDLKNKIAQTLNQYIVALSQLEHVPTVNKQKLRQMIEQLNKALSILHDIHGKIGKELRENEFLLAIHQRLSTPAGTSAFSIPPYHLWLQQAAKNRMKTILGWCEPFESLQKITDLLLKLTRESTELKTRTAKAGFYQAVLDATIPYQMIRIQIPLKTNLYPEISVGRHRLTIHFFEFNLKNKAGQTKNDVEFELACCKLYTKEEL